MNYLHKPLDLVPGDVVEVTLDHAANVQLLDATNYTAYQAGKAYSYYGGHVTHSPFRLEAPAAGRWHLVIDLGGGAGRVSASVSVLSPAHA